jgi:hypothetical protein
MTVFKDKKETKIFIAQAKGIHIYDVYNQSFSDVKLAETGSGIASCLTQSTHRLIKATISSFFASA